MVVLKFVYIAAAQMMIFSTAGEFCQCRVAAAAAVTVYIYDPSDVPISAVKTELSRARVDGMWLPHTPTRTAGYGRFYANMFDDRCSMPRMHIQYLYGNAVKWHAAATRKCTHTL